VNATFISGRRNASWFSPGNQQGGRRLLNRLFVLTHLQLDIDMGLALGILFDLPNHKPFLPQTFSPRGGEARIIIELNFCREVASLLASPFNLDMDVSR
jgi:hypothetical protein